MRERRRSGIIYLMLVFTALLIGVNIFWIWRYGALRDGYDQAADALQSVFEASENGETLAAFAEENGLSMADYPRELIELFGKNPETKDFVFNYPLRKDEKQEIDLSSVLEGDGVPLLMQWDSRWGYEEYAGGMMGLTGCGPTCLSMVAMHIKDDPSYDPRYIKEFSEKNGYDVEGSGSSWTLMSEGGKKLGFDVTEIPLDKYRIIRNLEVGNLIICVMGPGDFTETGHFIVMTGYEEGKVSINDPNSIERSNKLWELDKIMGQIKNLWVFR